MSRSRNRITAANTWILQMSAARIEADEGRIIDLCQSPEFATEQLKALYGKFDPAPTEGNDETCAKTIIDPARRRAQGISSQLALPSKRALRSQVKGVQKAKRK